MIAAEDDVDRLAPERAQRAERCVDDACVRARREHTDTAAAHARREESLVKDQGIRHSVPVAHRVVPGEPHLVRRHALDLAADEEEARKYVRLGVLRDAPTGALDRLNVGSGFNSTSVPAGVMVPRWSGRSGWRSTIGGGSPSSMRDRVMAATTPGEPVQAIPFPCL